MTERVVWPTPNTSASSGAMSFPATRYTPATAAPEGEKKHTPVVLTHTVSKQMGRRTHTAVCHCLSPSPQIVHSQRDAQRTNTAFHEHSQYSAQKLLLCVNIFQKMMESSCDGTLFDLQPQTVLTRRASSNSLSCSSSQYAVWAVVKETDSNRETFDESLLQGLKHSCSKTYIRLI